jgi:hypothetical protein
LSWVLLAELNNVKKVNLALATVEDFINIGKSRERERENGELDHYNRHAIIY